MASEWTTTTVGKFAPFEYGKGLPEGKRNPLGCVPVFGSNGVVGYHDTALTDGPTVIIGRKGTMGTVHYSPVPCWPIDTTFFLTGDDIALVRFKYYALKCLGLGNTNSDTAVPGLNRGVAHAHELQVPEEPEQRAIAHILGTLDDKIELNRRMNETLEEMAQALFKSWFVDFDPVRAKVEGQNPGLPKHIANLFPDQLVESELSEIPEGWEVKLFGDVVNRLRGNVNPGTYPDTVFSHFSIPAYDERQLPKEELGREIKSTKTRVPPGVVLLSKLNPEIERVWLVDVMEDETAVCSTEFLVLKAMPPIQRSYIYCLACNSLFREQIKSLVTGTSKSHQRVQVNAISKLEIVFPPEPIIQEFESRASELLNHGLACRREIKTLVALRDALLPKLVSGEIRLREAEKAVEVMT